MKRWLLRITLFLILLLSLLLALIASESGNHWLWQRLLAQLPPHLQIGRIEGRLLAEIRIYDLHYQDPNMVLGWQQARFRWQPSALWQQRLHIIQIELIGLFWQQKQKGKDQPPPSSLPAIELPLDILIEQILIKEARLKPLEAEPINIQKLSLQAAWQQQHLYIRDLRLQMPQLQAQAQAKVQPQGAYPLQISAQISAPDLTTQLQISGDLHQLQIEQRLEQPLLAKMQAQAQQLLGALQWQAQIQLAPPLPEGLAPFTLQIKATGDRQQAEIQARALAEEQSLSAQAQIQFQPLYYQAQGHWQNLSWQDWYLEQGELKAQGDLQNYQLQLQTQLAGPVPDGHWQLQAQGNDHAIQIEQLQAQILEGQLQAQGQVQWRPLSWQLNLSGDQLNPGNWAPDWPGQLAFKLQTQGKQQKGLQMQFKLQELQGQLRDRAIAGSADIQIQGQDYQIQYLHLQSGRAQMQAEGHLGEQWQLSGQMDIPELADLLPDASGMVQAHFQLSGAQKQPQLQAAFKAQQLHWQQYALQQADLKLDFSPNQASQLIAQLNGLKINEQTIAQMTMDLSGRLEQHQLKLMAQHELAQIELKAQGAYQEQQWQGELARLDLQSSSLGQWRLKQPSQIKLAKQGWQFSPLCLQGETELCLHNPQAKQINLALKPLSLAAWQDLLPEPLEQFSGELSAKAQIHLQAPIIADARVQLSEGELVWGTTEQRHRLRHAQTELQLKLADEQILFKAQSQIAQNPLQLELQLPRIEPLSQAPLNGKLRLHSRQLDLIAALVPDIERITGELQADLNITGQLEQPQLQGQAQLKVEQMIVPRAGLILENSQIQLQGNGQSLQLQADLYAGGGQLKAKGKVQLTVADLPADFEIKGRDFQLLNLPEAQVLISPDLKIRHQNHRLHMEGEILVPKALIELKELPESSQSISDDVLLVDEQGQIEQKMTLQIDAQIKLRLGEQVRFSGFGLNAELSGELTIDQQPGQLPTANGEIKIDSGYFRAYGQNLSIDSGRIFYAGGLLDNPGIQLQASRKIKDITVGIEVSGSLKEPSLVTTSSDPNMTEKERLSALLTGQTSGNLANASFYAGRQITPRLSVGVNLSGGEDGSEVIATYQLRDHIDVEVSSSASKSSVRLNYILEKE